MTKVEYTYEQKIAFIKSLYCPARAVSAETGCSWELILAQAAGETGWGEKTLPGTNNVFNIKSSAQWKGEARVFRVWEKVKGEKIWVNAPFRVYASIADSLRDRTEFLKSNPVYTKAGLFDPGTVGDFAKEAAALKKAGYATDEEYVQKLKDVWNGRTMKRAVAAAQAEGCGAQLPVIEIFLKDGARVVMPKAKIQVTFNGRTNEALTDAHGSIAIRIPPTSKGEVQLKVYDVSKKEWVTLEAVAIPAPVKSRTVTVLAPTVRVPTSTRIHDKPPAAAKPAAPAPAKAAAGTGGKAEHAGAAAHAAFKTESYKIVKGDTLASIAARHGMRYKTIADLNSIQSPYIIRPDQILQIPMLDKSDAATASHPHAPSHPPAASHSPVTSHPPAASHPAVAAQPPVAAKPAAPTAATRNTAAGPAAPASSGEAPGMLGDFMTALHAVYYRDEADKPKTDIMPVLKAPWMRHAEEEFAAKVKRIAGKKAHSHIVEYFTETNVNKAAASTDETAWCAAFCNWCLVKAGYKGNNSGWAADFKKWGRPTKDNKPALGAVALIRFKDGGHHVTFVAGISKDGTRLASLGGNQGSTSAVTHSHVPASWVVCYRYPSDYPDYADDYILHDVKADGASLTSANTHS